MITTIVLSTNDFDKVKETPVGEVFTPENSIVILAEDEEGIAGRMAIMNLMHLEGTWVRDNVRNGIVLKALESKLYEEAKRLGLTYLHTYAPTVHHETMLQRSGWERMPFSVWVKKLEE